MPNPIVRLLHGPLLLLVCGWLTEADAGPRDIVFDSSQSFPETRLELKDIGEAIPADWSGHTTLEIVMRASSPQRFHLKVFTSPGKEKFSRVVLHPYAGTWVRAAIPIAMLSAAPTSGTDMASVGNRSRPGYFLGLWGPFVPLKDVKGVSFSMEKPIGSPRLEIRSICVTNDSPGDAVLQPLPVMDEFGQCLPQDWPGKVRSLEMLKAAWAEEDGGLNSARGSDDAFDYCPFGGYRKTSARGTGFFRVEQIDGRWWFVDPHGHLFLSVGSDVMNPESTTPISGREALFRELPDQFLAPGRRGPGASFFTWNLARRFGTDWRPAWREHTFRRMDAWGLNTIGNWSDRGLWDAARKPYTIPLGGWLTRTSWLGLSLKRTPIPLHGNNASLVRTIPSCSVISWRTNRPSLRRSSKPPT